MPQARTLGGDVKPLESIGSGLDVAAHVYSVSKKKPSTVIEIERFMNTAFR